VPAYYRATIAQFLKDSPDKIVGRLSSAIQHNELQRRQIRAWQVEIDVLKSSFTELLNADSSAAKWSVLMEYPIPRRPKRLDVAILARNVVLCLEFKTEQKAYDLASQRQAEEYALDLRDFHEVSRDKKIAPILVVPKAPTTPPAIECQDDAVAPLRLANSRNLSEAILSAAATGGNAPPFDPKAWDWSPYLPIPTIIEAAEALYAGHNVREISRSHAGAKNLTTTLENLISVIQDAQQKRHKVLCVVSGVPGAGKTLAGLNLVHNPVLRQMVASPPIFLSGNGPLVKIVSAAIARAHKRREKNSDGGRVVGTFIQNVHVFLREGMQKAGKAPPEHVVVFDEAQRAWNLNQNEKKNGVAASEPETMLSIMDRHDWAVVVALVGGGQEIHNGEAGLSEWGKTLEEKFPHWRLVASPKALDGDSALSGQTLFSHPIPRSLEITRYSSLHLEVNLRSYRARKVTEWVEAVLNLDPGTAAQIAADLKVFPIAFTRSISEAREWMRERTRGQRRCGFVASSGALRLRADGLELSSGFRQGNRDMYVHWFLAQSPDVRSSNQLEVAASEFECQGLELDWVGVCWGGDLTFDKSARTWRFRNFAGSRWGDVKNPVDRRYLLNTYRVLLTRARQGLIIWIPQGDTADETRSPGPFDGTADYLGECGLRLV
jgi:hypothetical protein